MARDDGNTFLTGVAGGASAVDPNSTEEQKYTEEDVVSPPDWTWRAHDDGINWVTYIPELHMVATCAFDYNVFVWNADTVRDPVSTQHDGSLLLGNKVLPPDTSVSDLTGEARWYKE